MRENVAREKGQRAHGRRGLRAVRLARFGATAAFHHGLLGLVLGLLLAAACRDANVVTHTYTTLDEARQDGAVSGGYLPEGLPASTRDIREAHDPDTGRRWALFTFSPSDSDALRSLLQPEPFDLTGVTVDVPGRIEWWPLLLREQVDPAAIQATGLDTYRTRDGASVVAVNWAQGRAYLWRVAE